MEVRAQVLHFVMKIMIGEKGGEVLKTVKPYLAMILVQFGYAGLLIVSAATLKNGMDQNVLVVYRNLTAVAVIAPFALWFERSNRSKITVLTFFKIFVLAVLDPLLQQHLYYMGVKWTSASFASAMENLTPAITYLIALLLRAEKLELKRKWGLAKFIGACVTFLGTVTLILYKGPILNFFWNSNSGGLAGGHDAGGSKWIQGTFMLIGSSTCWASFLILQANTLEEYPSEFTLTCLVCSFGAAISTVVALVVGKGKIEPWIIGWDMRLLTVVYSGVVCTGATYYLFGMVMEERGPLFAIAFDPLGMVITVFMGSIILAEEISLGRIIGGAILVIGLYFLLWGKSRDHATPSVNKTEQESEFVELESNCIKPNSIVNSSLIVNAG